MAREEQTDWKQRKFFSKGRGARKLPMDLDYKNPFALRPFLTERFKIIPRRITGLSAADQRVLTVAVKRARHMAFIPYTTAQLTEDRAGRRNPK